MVKWCESCQKNVEPILTSSGEEVCPECGIALSSTSQQAIGSEDLFSSSSSSAPSTSGATGTPVKPNKFLKLTLLNSGIPDTTFEFTIPGYPEGVIVGRFDSETGPVDLDFSKLPDGSYVSRRHAKISFEDGSWYVEDLGSTNGTFVINPSGTTKVRKGEKVSVKNNDRIAFGKITFVVTELQ